MLTNQSGWESGNFVTNTLGGQRTKQGRVDKTTWS